MTDDADIAEARKVVGGIKYFWCLDDRDYEIVRLGGITNRVFRVDHMGEQYVLRLSGPGTAEYIDRVAEEQAARVAAQAGVSPDLVYSDPVSGVMVTRMIDEAVTMSVDLFRTLPGAPGRAGAALARLHGSGAVFPARFEAFEKIAAYRKLLKEQKAELPEGFDTLLREAEALRPVIEGAKTPLAPCHCDPFCEDFLDQRQSRMWIVDWEYAGMNDPLWDLGALTGGCAFSAGQETELLTAYFGAAPSAAQRGRVTIYKALNALVWTLWGLLQHANGNRARDFVAGAEQRFARAKALMADPDFFVQVKAAAGG